MGDYRGRYGRSPTYEVSHRYSRPEYYGRSSYSDRYNLSYRDGYQPVYNGQRHSYFSYEDRYNEQQRSFSSHRSRRRSRSPYRYGSYERRSRSPSLYNSYYQRRLRSPIPYTSYYRDQRRSRSPSRYSPYYPDHSRRRRSRSPGPIRYDPDFRDWRYPDHREYYGGRDPRDYRDQRRPGAHDRSPAYLHSRYQTQEQSRMGELRPESSDPRYLNLPYKTSPHLKRRRLESDLRMGRYRDIRDSKESNAQRNPIQLDFRFTGLHYDENSAQRLEPPRAPKLILLPDSILAEIVYYLSQSDNAKGPGDWDWVTVTGVSRQWRRVAMGTPRVWSCIKQFSNLERTKRFLKLSRNVGLVVYYSEPNVEEERVEKMTRLGRHLEVILKEMHRIRVLRIPVSVCWEKIVLSLLRLPAPRLVELKLSSDGDNYSTATRFPRSFEALKRVHLTWIALFIPPGIKYMRGLTELTLERCGIHGELKLSEVVRVLDLSPGMKRLRLLWCGFAADENPDGSKFKSVEMRCLEFLEIKMRNFSGCYALLECLTFPNGLPRCDVAIDELCCNENLPLFRIFFPLYKSLRICERARLSFQNGVFMCQAAGFPQDHLKEYEDASRLSLNLEPEADPYTVYRFVGYAFHIPLVFANTVEIMDLDNLLSEEALSRLLRRVIHAKHVHIRFGEDANKNEECLKALTPQLKPSSEASSAEGGTHYLPCRNLDHLSIVCPTKGNVDRLYECLEWGLKERSAQNLRLRKLELQRCFRDWNGVRSVRKCVKEFQFSKKYSN